jgi:hypothetical protein
VGGFAASVVNTPGMALGPGQAHCAAEDNAQLLALALPQAARHGWTKKT